MPVIFRCSRCVRMIRKGDIENKERQLRRFFAQSRFLFPEVWGPPHTMQAVVQADPLELSRKTLFPPSLKATLRNDMEAHNGSLSCTNTIPCTQERGKGNPEETCPRGNTATISSFSPSSLPSSTMGKRSNLYPTDEKELSLYTSVKWKGKDPRFLSNRFCSAWESEKDYGLAEVGIEEIARAVQSVWKDCGNGWQELVQRHPSASLTSLEERERICVESRNPFLVSSSSAAPPCNTTFLDCMEHRKSPEPGDLGSPTSTPERVLFLVLYSTTRHQVGNGEALHCIGKQVKHLIEDPDNIRHFSHVFRVVIVSVGIQAQCTGSNLSYPSSFPSAGAASCSSLLPPAVSDSSEAMDVIQFPYAGLYTFQGVLTCIAHLKPLSIRYGPNTRKEGSDGSTNPMNGLRSVTPTEVKRADIRTRLRPCVYVVSDGWLQPRSCRDACRTRQCPMGLLPAVVSHTISPKEVDAFSRYIACEHVRRRFDR